MTDRSAPLPPPLDGYLRQLQAAAREAEELVTGLSEAQAAWSPAPGRWSVAQCLDHLALTDRQYLQAMEAAAAGAAPARGASRGEVRFNWFERWFLSTLEPPPRLRMPAPREIQPPASRPLAQVLADFRQAHREVEEFLPRLQGLDLQRLKMRSPFAPIRLRVAAACVLIATHERRHLWQARQVTLAPGFPSA